MSDLPLDHTDRRIVNELQGGFPVSERPYADAAEALGLSEDELMARLERLKRDGFVSRFGPMYHAERMGGDVTLAALAVPEEHYEEVAALVNAHDEVAHNYAREHRFNMWFVVAAEDPDRIAEVLLEIEAETGLPVLNLPKREEYYVGLKVTL